MAETDHNVVVQVTGYDSEMGLFCNTCGVFQNDIWQGAVSIADLVEAASELPHKEPDPSVDKVEGWMLP